MIKPQLRDYIASVFIVVSDVVRAVAVHIGGSFTSGVEILSIRRLAKRTEHLDLSEIEEFYNTPQL